MVFVLKCSFLSPVFFVSALEMGQLQSLGGAEDSREFAQIPTSNMQIKQTSETLVGNSSKCSRPVPVFIPIFMETEQSVPEPSGRESWLGLSRAAPSPHRDFNTPQRLVLAPLQIHL